MFSENGIGTSLIKAAEILAKPMEKTAQAIFSVSDALDKVAEAIQDAG